MLRKKFKPQTVIPQKQQHKIASKKSYELLQLNTFKFTKDRKVELMDSVEKYTVEKYRRILLQTDKSIFVQAVTNMTTRQTESIRRALSTRGINFTFIKPKEFRVATMYGKLHNLSGISSGPNGYILSPSSSRDQSLKDMVDAVKEHKALLVLGGLVDDRLMSAKHLEECCQLDGLREFVSLLSTGEQIVSTLETVQFDVVRLLEAHISAQQKEDHQKTPVSA
ncbi:hypothetical protein MP638_002100 [Amoeboaphelidium occidentale]|nr:hypothetical protein MP638_002100 [Amoeboaphelidium occidentale]